MMFLRFGSNKGMRIYIKLCKSITMLCGIKTFHGIFFETLTFRLNVENIREDSMEYSQFHITML